MSDLTTIQGKVVSSYQILSNGQSISCYENAMPEASVRPLIELGQHEGKWVKVSGHWHGDLYEASIMRVINEGDPCEMTGKVVGPNSIEVEGSELTCFMHGITEARDVRLNLEEHEGKTVTVSGELHGGALYNTKLIQVGDQIRIPKIDDIPQIQS